MDAKENVFRSEGRGYDMGTALSYGMGAAASGPNKGHYGSVAPTTALEKEVHGLPDESYVLLKGYRHPTFHLAVKGEMERGFKVVKRGTRYYSVPQDWSD